MGEAGKRLLGAAQEMRATARGEANPPMPSPSDMLAMEAMSARFASALLDEGRKLPGPNADQTARMLALLSAARVLARLGMEPESAAAGMLQAVRLAQRQEIAAAGRKLIDEVGQ